jgi:hypothetical protein
VTADTVRPLAFGILAAATMSLVAACSSQVPVEYCNNARACGTGLTCVTGGSCATPCNALGDAGCPVGQACGALGPYCDPNAACPAIAIEVCLWSDGGP